MIDAINLNNHPKLHAFLTLAFAVAATVFFMLWLLQCEDLNAQRRANVCWGVVRSLGPAFSDVKPAVSTHPRCNVLGIVRSEADIKLLKSRLDEAFMPDERAHVFVDVEVRPMTEPAGN